MLEIFEPVSRSIADTTRVRILKMLEPGELCVCQITAILGLAPATVSKHLSLLKMAGLLSQRKDGRWVFYRLSKLDNNPYAPPVLGLLGRSPHPGTAGRRVRRRPRGLGETRRHPAAMDPGPRKLPRQVPAGSRKADAPAGT